MGERLGLLQNSVCGEERRAVTCSPMHYRSALDCVITPETLFSFFSTWSLFISVADHQDYVFMYEWTFAALCLSVNVYIIIMCVIRYLVYLVNRIMYA